MADRIEGGGDGEPREDPDRARGLHERFVELLREQGVSRVEAGRFGAMMSVELLNDGPVTLILESPEAEDR